MFRKTGNPLLFLAIAICGILGLTSCLGDRNSTSSGPESDLLMTAESFEELSTFSELADSINFHSIFADSSYYTLFAPTNDAFEQLPASTLDTLSNDALIDIFSYHLVETPLNTNELSNINMLETLHGDTLFFFSSGFNTVNVNNGELVAGNYQATDGILHATNTVLLPDSYLDITGVFGKRPSLEGFDVIVQATTLYETLQKTTEEGLTLFIPSNGAIENADLPDDESALQDTLEYHVIPQEIRAEGFPPSQTYETLSGQHVTVEVQNDTITINGQATVIRKNLEGTNGIIHVINQLLSPAPNN